MTKFEVNVKNVTEKGRGGGGDQLGFGVLIRIFNGKLHLGDILEVPDDQDVDQDVEKPIQLHFPALAYLASSVTTIP